MRRLTGLVSAVVVATALLLTSAATVHAASATGENWILTFRKTYLTTNYDSTTVTVGHRSDNANNYQDADTSLWYDARKISMGDCSWDGKPLLRIFTTSNAAAGDSLKITLQFSPDKTSITSKAITATAAAAVNVYNLLECQDGVNDTAWGSTYFRLIVADNDASRVPAFTNFQAWIQNVGE